jgi:hypothetical protein
MLNSIDYRKKFTAGKVMPVHDYLCIQRHQVMFASAVFDFNILPFYDTSILFMSFMGSCSFQT